MSALLLAVSLSLTAASPSPQAPPCQAYDGEGRLFPTCFDPARGLELGVGAAPRWLAGPGDGVAFSLRGGILLRTARESRSRRGSLWFFEQRILSFVAQPSPELREVTVTLYEGLYRRHLREGFILVPTRTPLRLPFPFDVALHAQVGELERRVYDGPGFRLEAARAAVLLDPIRSESGRFRLGLGPALSYTVRTDGAEWVHELSPFTSAVLDFNAESQDGWWAARLSAIAGWATIPGQGSFFRARGEAHVDRLLFAINDQPLWLSLGLRAAERDAGPFRRDELVGSLSLVMRAFGD